MNKILLVEDDQFLRNALRVKLERAEFEVLMANNGQEALKILESNRPDLMVADLVMPVMDGFDLLTTLQEKAEYKNLPIIVASNLSQKEDLDRAKELGAQDFFVKSDMSMEDLISKIKNLLNL